MVFWNERIHSPLLLILQLNGFFNFPTGCLEGTQFILHHIPDDGEVDSEVFMNENVSKSPDLAPFHPGCSVLDFFG